MTKKKSANAPDARWVRIDELIVDPELLKMIPRPLQADRDALLESLRDGQQLAIMVTIDLRVLDGYTRLELLKELGDELVLVQVVEGLDTREAELDYCININLHRRHLLDIQRVELGRAKLEVQARREAAERGREGARAGGRAGGRGRSKESRERPNGRRDPDRHDRESSAVIAKGVGLKSGRQYEKGIAVLDGGSPELVEQVRDGRMKINEAYGKVRAAAKQAEAAERATQFDEATVGGEVVHGDGLVVGPAPGTAALVVVDPPYGIAKSDGFTVRGDKPAGVGEALPEWDQVDSRTTIRASVKRVAELLTPTGSFYIFCDRLLVTVAWEEALAAGLTPRNTLYWIKTNPVPSGRRNWSSAVEVVLYGVKGTGFTWNPPGDAPNAITAPIVGGSERVDHRTQKPLAVIEKFIEASSNVGDLVVDFMAGSGTTGVAAKRLRRRFVLVEREERYVSIAKARLAAEPSITNAEAAAATPQPPTPEPPTPETPTPEPPTPETPTPEPPIVNNRVSVVRRTCVGVVTGRFGYTAAIDSTGEVLACTPVPTLKGGVCDTEGVARLVKSWVEAGVAEVMVEAPPMDGMGDAASLRADYQAWSEALVAHGVRHERAPEGWNAGVENEVKEAAIAFPDVEPKAVERGSTCTSRTKARALLVARYLMLHRTGDLPPGGGPVRVPKGRSDDAAVTGTSARLHDASVQAALAAPSSDATPSDTAPTEGAPFPIAASTRDTTPAPIADARSSIAASAPDAASTATVPAAITKSEPPSPTASSKPHFVGVEPGPTGYCATIDSDCKFVSFTPVPATGQICDADAIARVVRTWVEQGVALVIVREPPLKHRLGKTALLRAQHDYSLWMAALADHRQDHGVTADVWRDPKCGWDEVREASKAFPSVDLSGIDANACLEKASALLIARFAWRSHTTVPGVKGSGLAGFQPRRRRKPRKSAPCK